MKEGQEPAVLDWKDLLLVVLLCLVIIFTLDIVVEWAARRWSLDWLIARSSRGRTLAMVLSVAAGSWIGFRIALALGVKPVKWDAKLDSKPPLP
ncbi:hypothetical protein [Sphingomonas glaciei]|uniref:DUF1049 domain-containing protein n=1 Tax=Sphingomonas glaciei TaxID=2938948 RepID=A0ABY5MSK4_9SPHN|nr:hypothetical protein [Sphingomonas glaciei]UUR07118.1 hypothetical protein M1K48_09170 [Sphingomonas glaciei]